MYNDPYPQMQNYGGAYQPPNMVLQSKSKMSAIRWMLAIAGSLIGLLLGLIVLLLIGSQTGPVALLIGMVCATIPVPVYLSLLLWLDRYESEPLWLLAVAFFWGALIAVFLG